jgi:hypothetical protein
VFRSKSGVITHIELQSRNESRMVLRVAGYSLDLEDTYPGSEIHHFVLYFGLEQLRMPDSLVSRTGALRFQCRGCWISGVLWRRTAGQRVASDNLLAILTSDIDQRDATRKVLLKLKDIPAKQRGDHLAQLLIISAMRRLEPVVTEEARSIMPIVVDLMENSVIRDIVHQACVEAKLDDLTAMLTHRFGPLPSWADAKVRGAELADLRQWMVRMSDGPATIKAALSSSSIWVRTSAAASTIQ